ncbi:hypothetical protein BCR42DRAFT_302150, partial [Absidia repens]
MGRNQECYHQLGMSFFSRYQTEGLKALADTAASSRRILMLANALADETTNPPTDNTTHPLADDNTEQRADNTIDDNDVLLFPGSNDLFISDHCEYQLSRLAYKKV